ncbi:MAG: hypothetical protein AAB650_00420 [Patescibacteria group bacterium]
MKRYSHIIKNVGMSYLTMMMLILSRRSVGDLLELTARGKR